MRLVLCLYCVFLFCRVYGNDSLVLREVLITDSLIKKSTFQLHPTDKIPNYSSVSENLNIHTPLIFRTNGLGGVTSLINRGMPGGQMQVYWNGIPLNNSVIGYTDLSIFQNDDFSSISLLNHTSYGSPGGLIQLNTFHPSNIKKGVFLRSSSGSFKRQSQQISSIFSMKKVSFNLQAGFESSVNNFPYTIKNLSGSLEKLRQSNAEFSRYRFSGSVFYEINTKNQLQFHNLWTRLDREMPNPIGLDSQNALLLDNVFVAAADYKNIQKKSSFQIKTSYYNSLLEFTQESADVFSTTRLQKAFTDAEWKQFFNQNWTLSVLARHESNFAQSNNFSKNQYLQTSSVGLNTAFLSGIHFMEITLLENFFNRKTPQTGFYSQYRVQALKNKRLYVAGMLSRDILFPTFNDMFWPVVGNTDLKPQKSMKAEISIDAVLVKKENLILNNRASGYVQKLNDFILWSPDSTLAGLWSPKNLQDVFSRGLENKLQLQFNKNHWKYESSLSYNFNIIENLIAANDRDLSVKRQLVYRPKHSLKWNNTLTFKDYFLQLNWQYIGDRTTVYSLNPQPNKDFLPAYHLADLSVGSLHSIKKWYLGWQFDMNNLYKTKYQEVQNFATPLNHYLLTLKIQYYVPKNQ